MNRGVLQRQMFAKGGAAGFPDLNKDGNITQADILMGRGVEFKQEGGIAGMMPMPQEGGQAMDPQVLNTVLGAAAEQVGDLDGAQDYEEVMNSIRGDDATIEQRYAELAGVVGEEDARATPESVLTLVQPAMVMAASVDQGIGELAQEEMSAPVEGAMAQGIMSTVPQPEPQPMPMEGPPPVNFKDGGLVRRGDNQPVQMYAPGGEVTDPIAGAGRLGELYQQKMPLYTSILGDPTADLEKQKDLTQSQMLFDIANTALAFAAPMEGERPGMSAAERLAYAARTTQLPQTIGARAQAQLDKEAAAKAQQQQMKLSALTAAESGLAAEQEAAAALERKQLEGAQSIAEIELRSKLDFATDTALKNMDIQGELTVEQARQAGRVALEGVQQDNRVAIKKLEGSQNQADLILADKLKKENMEIQANIDLGKMDVAHTYELAKMDIGHEYATELQNSRIASQELIANNRLELDTLNSALNQARADKELQISQGKLELAQQTEARIAEMDKQRLELEAKGVALDELKLQLEGLNVEGKNKAQQVLARPGLLEGYAKGTLNEAQTLAVNSAIDQLSTRDTVINADGTTTKTGGQIPQAAKEAIIARSKLPNAADLLMPREIKRITAKPIKFGEAVSTLMQDIPDASIAFGSDAFARNVANTVIEAVSFGLAEAPYQATDKAISAVKQLNLDTLTHFQDIKELRDSVALMKKLEEQTANPGEFLTGDTRGRNKTNTVLKTIDDLISVLDLKTRNYTDDSEEFRDAMLAKQKALQLRAGFEVIQRSYAVGGSGGGRSSFGDKQDAGANILFGTQDK